MANPADEQIAYPFTAFNFGVEIRVDASRCRYATAAFQECDGLEMTMDVKTIREGGNNGKEIRLTARSSLGR